MSKKKPYNILVEAFALGMRYGISSIAKGKMTAVDVEAELDKLAATFGYSGIKEFDKTHITTKTTK